MSQFGPSDWMKKGIPLGYTRISTNDQDKSDLSKSNAKAKPTIKKQFAFIQDRLKSEKLPEVKKENWFAEVGSGTDRKRGQWNLMIRRAVALAAEGKRPFIVVQDPSRFARNARHAMVAIDELHEAGVPVLAARESIQTGSAGDLHPTEELIFIQLLGSSAYVSQVQKEKADQSVDFAKKEGIMSGTGASLFPFAKKDFLDLYYEHIDILRAPAEEGIGGPKAWATVVANEAAPFGPTVNSVRNTLRTQETERREKLTPQQYKAWREYRDKIRNILIERQTDPWGNKKGQKAGKLDFGAKAMMRMVGRALQEPWTYRKRSDKEIQEYLNNPKPYLSVSDSKLYRQAVSKR